MTNDGKPLLLIDVDGPLNPWAASGRQNQRNGYRRYRIGCYIVYLKRAHGQALMGLSDVFDLVWCTTWEDQANTDIGPRIGLPELPVIRFPEVRDRPDARLHWKTATIVAYAEAHKRPFAWIDDEMGVYDGTYFARWCTRPFLVKKIDPAVGLTDNDFAELRDWAEGGMHDDGEAA